MDRIDKFTDHRVLGCTDQIQVLALNLVHHRIHLFKTHNACHDIATDHKRRYAVSKSTVDHKISRIRDHCGMQSRDVAHQIIETVTRYLSGSVKINTVKTAHNVCMIRNLKIGNHRLTKLLDLHIAGIIRTDRNRRVNDIRDHHHILCHLLGILLLLLLKLCQTLCEFGYLCLDCFCLLLFALLHQSANLLGQLISLGTQVIRLLLCCTGFCIQLDHFIDERQLFILKFLFDIFFYHIGVFT